MPLDKMALPLKFLETSVSRVGGPAMISKPWEWFTNDTHIPKKPVTPSWMLASPGIRNDNPWQVKIPEKVTIVSSNYDESEFLQNVYRFLVIASSHDDERLNYADNIFFRHLALRLCSARVG